MKSKNQIVIIFSSGIFLLMMVMGILLLQVRYIEEINPIVENEDLSEQVYLLYHDEKESEILNEIWQLMFMNPDTAIIVTKLRLDSMILRNDEYYAMQYYNLLGVNSFIQSDFFSALNNYYNALQLALNMKTATHAANIYNNMGICNIIIGNYEKALSQLNEAKKFFEDKDLDLRLANVLNNIGRLYYEINDLKESFRYYSSAYPVFNDHSYYEGLSSLANHLGKYYLKKNLPDSALSYFQEATEISLRTGNYYGLIEIYEEVGNFYQQAGNPTKAVEYFSKSDSTAISMNLIAKSSFPKIGMASSYLAMNEPEKALYYARKAEEIAQKYDNTKISYEVSTVLSKILESLGDNNGAYQYFKFAHELNQDLYLKTEISQMYNMIIENLGRELEIKALEAQKEKLLLNKSQNALITIIILLFLGIIIISFIYYVYRYKTRQLQKNKLNEHRRRQAIEKSIAIMNAEINERKRIGAELHDGIGSQLSLAKLNLTHVLQSNNDSGHQSVIIKNSIHNVDNVIKEMRNISKNVAPIALGSSSFADAVRDLVQNINQLKHLKISLSIVGLKGPLQFHIEHALYRLLQETVNNAVKHSECREIQIQILKDDQEIMIMVEDDGKGFDVPQILEQGNTIGSGLKNVIARIEGLNGVLLIDSLPKRGTIITAKVPLEFIES